MTVLGIDYGERRIGLAITDELDMIASPLKTIENNPATLAEIKKVVDERKVDTIVVGLPLSLSGEMGPSGLKAKAFADSLRAEVSITVDTFDERLTTVQAERSMLRHDVTRAKRAKHINEMAAQILLQSYVDCRKRRRGEK